MPQPELDTSPGRHDWPAGGLPIVFPRQPSSYAVVRPERLADWEQLTAELLGLAVEPGGGTHLAGMETVSFCGWMASGEPIACDSDVLPQVMEA